MAIIGWFLFALFCLLALVFVVISLPFHYQGYAHIGARVHFGFQLRLWRLLRFEGVFANGEMTQTLALFGHPMRIKEDKPDKEKKGKKKGKTEDEAEEKSEKDTRSKGPKWTWSKIRETVTFVRTVLNMVLPHELSIEGRLGFSEPHETAYALLLLDQLRHGRFWHIAVEPVWHEEACDLDVKLRGSFIPLMLLIKLLRYALSPTMRRHWLAYIRRSRQPA